MLQVSYNGHDLFVTIYIADMAWLLLVSHM